MGYKGLGDRSVRAGALEEELVTVFAHPAGAGKVGLPSISGAFGFAIRVYLQHNASDLAPIGIILFGI